MRKLILISLLLFLISCKKENIEGVEIGKTLLENQNFAENKKLDTIIRTTLKGDFNSLRRLNHFPCGDGAGCYDKGFIITQIIYKIGENNFNKMVDNLDRKELYGIEDYIQAGLEYGDNNKDGKMDNKIAEKEFPILMKKLSEK
jgi:hypothetical protein